jgi:hypothetical protein
MTGEVRDCSGLLVHDAIAERLECANVERLRGLEVAHVHCYVCDRHGDEWQTASMLLPSGSRTNAA